MHDCIILYIPTGISWLKSNTVFLYSVICLKSVSLQLTNFSSWFGRNYLAGNYNKRGKLEEWLFVMEWQSIMLALALPASISACVWAHLALALALNFVLAQFVDLFHHSQNSLLFERSTHDLDTNRKSSAANHRLERNSEKKWQHKFLAWSMVTYVPDGSAEWVRARVVPSLRLVLSRHFRHR